jgi:hypothetical protein
LNFALSVIKLKSKLSWALWLMPVILATWEAEFRRNAVLGQPGKIVHETLSAK